MNPRIKRAILVSAIILMLTVSPCAAQEWQVAPTNPDYLEYLASKQERAVLGQDSESIGSGYSLGLIPTIVDLSHLQAPTSSVRLLNSTPLPVMYDLRSHGRVTPVRNQSACGSCWAFASYGSLESTMLPFETWNLSENHLKNSQGAGCCDGGTHMVTTAYLARWSGAVSEIDDPYNWGNCTSPPGLNPARRVRDVYFLPARNRANPLDIDFLKEAVMEYGAVYTTFGYHGNRYNPFTYAHYEPDYAGTDHAVCIVGWDDTYPRSNFRPDCQPPGNGAFIIKNSWGSGFGENGYMYISYYDASAAYCNVVFIGEYEHIYSQICQYDPNGWTDSIGQGSTTGWSANVFTSGSYGELYAVSFYAVQSSASYEVRIYLNPTDGPINPNGPILSQSGTLEHAGYKTITLDRAIPVSAGQRFSVVVKVTTPGYNHPIAIESGRYGGTANPGESFVSANGTSWTDLTATSTNSNVCIKAFMGDCRMVSVTPEAHSLCQGPNGGPFSPQNIVYTLTNGSSRSITWIASKSESWVTLSSGFGTLSPGQSTTVTASLNSYANSLATGFHQCLVSFEDVVEGCVFAVRRVGVNVKRGGLTVKPNLTCKFGGPPGGPFASAYPTFTLANEGYGTINWSASKTRTWLTISPSSGTLAPGQTAVVQLSIGSSANSLSPNLYSDTVTFTNTSNGVGNTTRGVTLHVGRVYVSTTGNDNNSGSSWALAKRTLQAGISAASLGMEVWVARGQYPGNVVLQDNTRLYGGFYGNETSLDQRDPDTHLTGVLGDGFASAVTIASYAGPGTRFDGFIVESETGTPQKGGGIYCGRSTSATIANCKILGNRAYNGGGMYIDQGSSAVVSGNVFDNNTAVFASGGGAGGAIYCDGAQPTISGNTINGNSAYRGAGLLLTESDGAQIVSNDIRWNQAGFYGGGINLSGNPLIANNVIADNSAIYGGGISANSYSPTLYNNTIVGNTATGGGGLHYWFCSDSNIVNNIIAHNTGSGVLLSMEDIIGDPPSLPVFAANCFFDNSPSECHGFASPVGTAGNFSADPKFVRKASWDYRLTGISPCIDAGRDDGFSGLPVVDRDGNIRPWSGNMSYPAKRDIGAYEYGPWIQQIRSNFEDGTWVAFGPVSVSAVIEPEGCGNWWTYVQRLDRLAGIRMDTPLIFSEERSLHVYGTLYTDGYTGERFVIPHSTWPRTAGFDHQNRPLNIRNQWLGGGAKGHATVVKDGFGFYNVGLYAMTWGTVTYRDPAGTYFYIDDGSRLQDGSGHYGVRVIVPMGVETPAFGSYVKVLGISSTASVGGNFVRAIRPRNAADIRTITWWTTSGISVTPGQWNYLVLPGLPKYADQESVFVSCPGQPGLWLDGNLTRYNSQTQQWLTYIYCSPDSFGNGLLADGFGLYVPSNGTNCYSYQRTPMWDDILISLPRGSVPMSYFSLVGHSYDWHVSWMDLEVTDGLTSMSFPEAVAEGWVHAVQQWNGSSWVQVDVSNPDALMIPQKAYKIFTSKDNMAIMYIVP